MLLYLQAATLNAQRCLHTQQEKTRVAFSLVLAFSGKAVPDCTFSFEHHSTTSLMYRRRRMKMCLSPEGPYRSATVGYI